MTSYQPYETGAQVPQNQPTEDKPRKRKPPKDPKTDRRFRKTPKSKVYTITLTPLDHMLWRGLKPETIRLIVNDYIAKMDK